MSKERDLQEAAYEKACQVQERDSIETHTTAQQIAEAQELARKCTANKFKGC